MPGATRVGNMLPVDAVACCRPSLAVVSLPTVVANWWPQKHFKRCLRLSVHDGDYEAAAHGSAASADYPVCCAGSANNKRLCVCVCVFVRIRARIRARSFVFFASVAVQCIKRIKRQPHDWRQQLLPPAAVRARAAGEKCCTAAQRQPRCPRALWQRWRRRRRWRCGHQRHQPG